MSLKILHLAPENFAGIPYDYYKMHLYAGDYSRLVTYHRNPLYFPEDICLDLPLHRFYFARLWRRKKVLDRESEAPLAAPFFKPKNPFEALYFRIADAMRQKKVNDAIRRYRLDDFEIIHYDGGLDLFRDARQAIRWKKQGKKIVCCYYGSDLRTRGLIPALDAIADLNITSEYDHLALKKNLHYIFYPYDTSELPERYPGDNEKCRIVHSPTNRKFKGTGLILAVMIKVCRERPVDFILLENRPRSEVLAAKSRADICIDQVGGMMGGTGYGKSGLEAMAMGIPTITNMSGEYRRWLPENPFVVANNGEELYKELIRLIDSKQYRVEAGKRGTEWVRKYHGYESVNEQLMKLYGARGIFVS